MGKRLVFASFYASSDEHMDAMKEVHHEMHDTGNHLGGQELHN